MVILPILASIFLLILTSRLNAAARAKFDAPVRMATFIISIAMFVVATLMFLGEIGGVNWESIAFNTFEYQESMFGLNNSELHGLSVLTAFPSQWFG